MNNNVLKSADLLSIDWIDFIVGLEDRWSNAEKFAQFISELKFQSVNPKMKLFLNDLSARYPLTPHPMQLALMKAVENGIRFPCAPCGRRSGKTERAKRFLANMALKNGNMRYFAAAPTGQQATKIWWADLKKLTCSSLHKKQPNQTEKIIYLDNGTEIHVISLDNPKRIEGIAWDGGVIDEIADVDEKSWEANIFPALNTKNPTRPNCRPWCWLIGVPDGHNHYYRICQAAKTGSNPEFQVFHWTTAEVIPEVAEINKRIMSEKQYNQEFNASFETANDKVYENYSDDNLCNESIKEDEILHWMHDFNYSPMSSAIGVIRNNMVYVLDEIVLEGAISLDSAKEFIERYRDHKKKHVIIYGDSSGKAGEKHGQLSNYTTMEEALRKGGWTFQRCVPPKNPAIKDRHNSVRAKIKSHDGKVELFVNPKLAKTMHEGLSSVQYKDGSTIDEIQTRVQHITTGLGYFIDFKWPKNRNAIEKNLKTFGFN